MLIVATQLPASYFVQTHGRFAASLNQNCEAEKPINTNQHPSIEADFVMDGLELTGSPVEPQIHADGSEHSQRELARYEEFFDINWRKKKQKVKKDSSCDARMAAARPVRTTLTADELAVMSNTYENDLHA